MRDKWTNTISLTTVANEMEKEKGLIRRDIKNHSFGIELLICWYLSVSQLFIEGDLL